jgi:hypothetical protein
MLSTADIRCARERGVVDVSAPQGVHNGLVATEAVRRQLDALTGQEAGAKVSEERVAILSGALTDEPRRDKLRVSVDRVQVHTSP